MVLKKLKQKLVHYIIINFFSSNKGIIVFVTLSIILVFNFLFLIMLLNIGSISYYRILKELERSTIVYFTNKIILGIILSYIFTSINWLLLYISSKLIGTKSARFSIYSRIVFFFLFFACLIGIFIHAYDILTIDKSKINI